MIAEKLEYWAKKEPGKTALQMRHEGGYDRVTYSELWNLCLNAASKLRDSGIRSGDHIALYGENGIEWVVSYLGIHILGAVVVPLDAELGTGDIMPLITFSHARAILTDDQRIEKLEPLFTDSSSPIQMIPIESLRKNLESTNSFQPYRKEPDDLMSIIFTSGTTGTPKGVQLTRGNIESNIEAVLSQIKISNSENILNILPLHHSFACTMGLLTPLWAGAAVTFSHSLKSTDLLGAMRETGVTIFPGVPKLFTLLDREIFKKIDLLPTFSRTLFWTLYTISKRVRETTGVRLGKLFFRQIHCPFGEKLRFFASGGAKLDAAVSERFLNLGFLILEGYGLTETSPVISITPPANPKPGTAGRAIPGVEVRIDTRDGGDTGEICVRGPNVMKGYYENEKATKEVIRGGWLHTGDLGMIDSEGNIVITGRAKEVIVLPSGKNIYPEEVEKHYENVPFVKELCVLSSLDGSGAVKGLKMVIVPDAKELSARGVYDTRERIRWEIAGISSRLPSYMQITELVLFFDELPRTRLGKLRRGEIERLLKEQKAVSNDRETTLSAEEKTLMEAPHSARFLKRLGEIGDVKGPFSPNQDLSLDLGLDSLTLIEITVLLENEFGVKLKEEEIPYVRTIGDILKRIQEASSEYNQEEKELSLKTALEEPPAVPLEEIFNLNRGIIRRLIVRIIHLTVYLIVKAAFRPKVGGFDKLPEDRSFLLCPNHQSYIDPLLIFAFMPGNMVNRLLFIGFGEIFRRPPLSWLKRPARLIPTGSTGTFGESLKLAYGGLKRDMIVCIFPEGGRTTTGDIMQPRPGAGILSVEAKVPIVPVLIDGAINTLSHLHPEFKFVPVRIIAGNPIEPPTAGDNAKGLYQEAADRWKEAMCRIQDKS